MAIYQEIRSALEQRLASTSGLPAIAWENVPYSPTTGTPYLKPQFIPVTRRQAAMATTPPHYYRGIFRVLCYQPEGQGPGASQNLVDTLIDRFETTTDITSNGITVSIEGVQQESSYINSPWYVTPVTVSWFIYNT